MAIETRSLDRDLRHAAHREAATSSFWTDVVVYGLLVAIVGGVSLLTRGVNLWSLTLAATGTLVASVSWVCTYLRHREHFSALYLREWNAHLHLVRDEELVRLAARLAGLGVKEGTAQIKDLKQGFDAFRKVLKRKFNSTELTYQRYDLLLQNLFLSVVDNLERAAEKLEVASNFRPDEDRTFNPRDSRPAIEVLKSSAKELLEKNVDVLAALSKAGLKMSKVQTRRRRARREMDAVLADLSRMIDNVHRYALDSI